jgi:hypothetical protein
MVNLKIKNNYMKSVLLISLMGLFNNCEKIYSDDKLSLSKKEYNGHQLKIDGYYYNVNKFSNKASVYVFFKNGVLLNAGAGYDLTVPNNIELALSSPDLINKLKQDKTCWGLFRIDSNIIEFERWYHSGGSQKKVFVNSGIIINDTTFHITSSRRSDGSDKKFEDEIYKFRKYSPKPDSTNSYTP